jgi:hypothetical protein
MEEYPKLDVPARLGTYKGNSLIILPCGADREFSFGMTKAKVILQYMENIKKFVESNGEACK